MDWQQVSALVIVATTAGIFAWNRVRRRRFTFGRDGHCGCSNGAGHEVEQSSIVFHARKGQRPEVIVKMK